MPRLVSALLLWMLCAGFEWPGKLEQLTHEASHAEPERRREVMQQLASYPPGAASEALLQGLDDSDPQVRLQAAHSAGTLRLAAAAPALTDWLDEPDLATRSAAARALGQIGEPGAVPKLSRLLADSDAGLRRTAAEALAKLGGDDAAVPLLGCLDDPDPGVRLAVVEALGTLASAQAVVPLLGRTDDPALEVRTAVLATLGELGDARALPRLHMALTDTIEVVRLAAAAALGRLGAAASVEPLGEALKHADGRLDAALLAALGNIDADPARALLLAQLDSVTRRTQASAALAENARRHAATDANPVLQQIAEGLAATTDAARLDALCQTLVAMARSQSIEAASEALIARLQRGGPLPASLLVALSHTGSPGALMPLLERFAQADDAEQGTLLTALEVHFERSPADGRAADPLLELLPQLQGARRVQAVQLLGQIGATRSLEVLRPLLGSSDDALRRAALEAVGAIGDPQSTEALLGALRDRDPTVRHAAAEALPAAASTDSVRALLGMLGIHDGIDHHAVVQALGRSLAALAGRQALDPELAALAGRVLHELAVGEDEGLAARAVHAVARWHPPGAGQILGEVLRFPSSRRRYLAALSMAELPAPDARGVLRFLLRSGHPRVMPAAVLALAEVGDARDVPALLRLSRRYPWPMPAATSYALARMARRGVVRGLGIQTGLCELGKSREPYVRANVATALAALEARPCEDGPDPLGWLSTAHAPAVRAAAAGWAHAAARRERIDPVLARQRLTRCAVSETEPSVARACAQPQLPASLPGTELVARSSDGSRVLRDALLAVRLADGLVFVARSDNNGLVYLPSRARGPLLLEDPAQAPLEAR